ncbi:MAG: two component system histidine kinase [Gammaproteobacteria bacterium]|nr:two component system histidine kinase [Gammaproteobacteria bacterium]
MKSNANIESKLLYELMQSTSDFIILLAEDGTILNLSESAAKLYKQQRSEICGINYFKFLKQLQISFPISLCDLHKIKENVEKKNFNSVMLIDGETINIHWHIKILCDKESRYYLFFGVEELGKLKKTAEKFNQNELTLLKKLSQQVLGESAKECHSAEEYAYAIHHHLMSIIECMPGNVYWMDKNCIYLGANKNSSEFMGFKSPSDVIGKTYEDFEKMGAWKKSDSESFKNDDLEVIRTGKPKLNVEEPPLKGKDGELVQFLTSRVPIFNKNKEITGVVGISIDISERKRMEELRLAKEAAELSGHAKSKFIANMSHDIRTPITGMIGMVQDLLNIAHNTETVLKGNTLFTREDCLKLAQDLTAHIKNDSDILMSSVDQLLQLCNEILEATRLEYGAVDQLPESFDLHDLVQHNIELLQPVAKSKKLDLISEIDARVPKYVKGLRSYADRALLNIISNALKFTKTGYVKIKMNLLENAPKSYKKSDEVTVQISIEDTGMGIPKDKFETIFEQFSRLTPSYEGVYKGSGLGLYTVKQYLAAMGSDIKVESEIGKGTCFTITVPFIVSDTVDKPRQSIRVPAIHSIPQSTTSSSENLVSPSSHVLIVEDSIPAAMALKTALQSFQCAVDVATDGAEAINKARDNTYDFVLMDVGLPDISGVEVAQKIRTLSHPKKSQVPIVALTGHADDSMMRQRCLDAGMQEVCSKPAYPLMLEQIFQRFVFHKECSQQKNNVAEDIAETNGVVIDWQGCVHMTGGNEDMAREILLLISDDMINAMHTIEKYYPARDAKVLRAELHRVLGGVAYVRLPKLESALKDFQDAVKAEPPNFSEWERTYETLKKVTGQFQDAFRSGNY